MSFGDPDWREWVPGEDACRVLVDRALDLGINLDDPNSGGLSWKAIEQEPSNSRDRLGVEAVDLYQIHRWDDDAPIETTIRTLNDAVRRGYVRYLGASSMWADQFAEVLHASDRLGLERFGTMQNHYNLLYREEEREMNPLCARENVGVIPWSPLARMRTVPGVALVVAAVY